MDVQFHDLLNQWGDDDPMLVSRIQDEVMLSKEEINLRNRFEEKMQKLFATPSPSPNEDAHSEDRLASINTNEVLEDRLNDMLEAGSTLLPSLSLTMAVAPQVLLACSTTCLLLSCGTTCFRTHHVLPTTPTCSTCFRTHHVHAHASLLTCAPLAE